MKISKRRAKSAFEKEILHCTEATKSIQWMLSITGLWPDEEMSKIQIIKFLVNWIYTMSILITLAMEGIKMANNLTTLSDVLVTAMPYFTYGFKLYALTFKRNEFLAIIKDLNSEIFNRHFSKIKKPIRHAIRLGNFIARLFKMMVVFVLIFYGLFPFFDQKSLPIPFSYEIGNLRYLMHLHQLISLLLTGWNISCIDVLFSILMMLAAAQIDVLQDLLKGIVDDAEDYVQRRPDCSFVDVVQTILKECVQLHVAIIRYLQKVDRMFSFAIFVQYTTGTVLICSCLVQLSFTIDPRSLQYVLSIVFISTILLQFSMYHWFGNNVLFKSTLIGEACYMSRWYKCSNKHKKMLLVIMERAKRPLSVTVYKFTVVSLASFVVIVKWSYSFYAVVRSRYSS